MRITANPLLLIAALALHSACGTQDDYQQMSHADFLKSHPYSLGQATLSTTDERRGRPQKIEIWYPTRDSTGANVTAEYPFRLPPTSQDAEIPEGKFPLVLLSHGTGGNRISQMWLACELAGQGYIAVAADHYGNTLDNKIPENFVKIWDRPLDIRFVIDHLLAHPVWASKIDTARIGMAGFSLGGYTAIALAGGVINYDLLRQFAATAEGKKEFDLPELGDISSLITPAIVGAGQQAFSDLRDPRIKVFVAMAPAIGQGFQTQEQFAHLSRPLLIIGAANDQRSPVQQNARHYHALIPGSEYLEIEGKAGHYVFMNEATRALQREAPLVFQDDPQVNRGALHRQLALEISDFIAAGLGLGGE